MSQSRNSLNRPPEWWSQTELTDQSVSDYSARHEEAKRFLCRSIYYGMLLKIGDAYGMMCSPSTLQAAALLLAIALTLSIRLALAGSILASWLPFKLCSPRQWHFCLEIDVPDMFAGIAILATANLIIYAERMNRVSLFAWVGLLGAAPLFHSTHVLVALAIFVWFLFCRVFLRGSASWTGLESGFLLHRSRVRWRCSV